MRRGLGGQAGKLIIGEMLYETASPTVEPQIVQITAANPDIFADISTTKFTAQLIKKLGELKWTATHFLTNTSTSVSGVMKPAGIENGQGVLKCDLREGPEGRAVEGRCWHAGVVAKCLEKGIAAVR